MIEADFDNYFDCDLEDEYFLSEHHLHELFDFNSKNNLLEDISKKYLFHLNGEVIGIYYSSSNTSLAKTYCSEKKIGIVTGKAKPLNRIKLKKNRVINIDTNCNVDSLIFLTDPDDKDIDQYYFVLDISRCEINGIKSVMDRLAVHSSHLGELISSCELYSDIELTEKNNKVPNPDTGKYRLFNHNAQSIPELKKFYSSDDILPLARKVNLAHEALSLLLGYEKSFFNFTTKIVRQICEKVYEQIDENNNSYYNVPFAVSHILNRTKLLENDSDITILQTVIKLIQVLEKATKNDEVIAVEKNTMLKFWEIYLNPEPYDFMNEALLEVSSFDEWLDKSYSHTVEKSSDKNIITPENTKTQNTNKEIKKSSLEIDDFSGAELKFLKDLRFIYDACNPNFVKGKYGAYIPLGILIVQVITVREPINKSSFADDEFTLYAKYVNWEYIKVGHLIADAIRDGLTLIDPRINKPFCRETAISHLECLTDNSDDNFSSLLGLHVAYDELLKVLLNMQGLSRNDPNIKAISMIGNEMLKQYPYVQPMYHTNNLIYEPIKDCLVSDESQQGGSDSYCHMEQQLSTPENEMQQNKTQVNTQEESGSFLDVAIEVLGTSNKSTYYKIYQNILLLVKENEPHYNEDILPRIFMSLLEKYHRSSTKIHTVSDGNVTLNLVTEENGRRSRDSAKTVSLIRVQSNFSKFRKAVIEAMQK